VVQFSTDELAQLKQDVPGVNRTLDFVMLEQLVSSGNAAPADVSMAIANFLRPLLDRSAPALFAIIRPLCNGERSVLSYVIDILERESTSSAVAWLSLARAHLHAGRPDLALAVFDKHEKQEGNGALAEDLKPDALLVRAKVLRKLGRFSDAVVAAEAARQLDLNDRYLCSKAVKAMLVANDVSAAEKTMQIFATKEAGPIDMQTIWYELLMTDAHVRLGALDKAYDMARTTVKHVDDFREDEYDFHTYSLRKATLSAYIDLLRTSDRWFAHPAFRRAATSMIDISLVLEKDAKEREETVARLSKGAFMEEANVDMLTWAVMVRSYVHSKKLLLAVKCALRGMAKAKRIISSADVGRFYVECKSLVQKFNQLASAKVSTFGKEPLAEVEQWVSAFETSAGTSNEYVLAAAVITGAEKLEVLETKVVTAIQQAAVGTNQRQQLLQLVTLMQRCGGVAAEQRLREHVKSI
jgi:tetratricopeptide (TPR) repeat protein